MLPEERVLSQIYPHLFFQKEIRPCNTKTRFTFPIFLAWRPPPPSISKFFKLTTVITALKCPPERCSKISQKRLENDVNTFTFSDRGAPVSWVYVP